jgi:glycosyltransferase involved in cell wall biosynthesis
MSFTTSSPTPGSAHAILVVPCHNEARRLCRTSFERFLHAASDTRVVFVNDGSTDATLEVLHAIQTAAVERVAILDLPANVGKGEAIRRGLQYAFRTPTSYCGFWDADLATPLDAVAEFVKLLDDRPEIEMVFGTRVHLLGREIRRRAVRHYLGRVSATAISLVLGLRIYDTQCGAKMFRVTPAIQALFDQPFLSSWIFDVEIVARLIAARRDGQLPAPERVIYEYPLTRWTDIAGSSVGPRDYLRAVIDLARIHRRYLRP